MVRTDITMAVGAIKLFTLTEQRLRIMRKVQSLFGILVTLQTFIVSVTDQLDLMTLRLSSINWL